MGIFDQVKSFLKIGRTAINKPKQDIDIESINFDDTIKTKWTGDISIWQDIDLTNNIWETEERSFRQKLNDSWDTEANNSVYDDIWKDISNGRMRKRKWFWIIMEIKPQKKYPELLIGPTKRQKCE